VFNRQEKRFGQREESAFRAPLLVHGIPKRLPAVTAGPVGSDACDVVAVRGEGTVTTVPGNRLMMLILGVAIQRQY